MLLAPFLWIFCEFDEKVLDNLSLEKRYKEEGERTRPGGRVLFAFLKGVGRESLTAFPVRRALTGCFEQNPGRRGPGKGERPPEER